MAEAQVSNAFTVSVDGKPMPADLVPLMVSAVVDDSLNLPDLVILRFRDPDRTVLAKSGMKIGSKLVVAATSRGSTTPAPLITAEVTALEVEFDTTGTFTVVRGFDPAHRLFRGRRTETYTQVTASDVAKKVAQRVGLTIGTVDATSTVFDHLSQGGVSDWEFLDGLAREIGHEVAVKDGKFEFRAPKPATDAPAPKSEQAEPLLLRQGSDLIRFRAVVTSAEQVKEVQVRGWDVASKKALVGTAPAKTRSAQLSGSGVAPTDLAKTFGDPVYVATDVPFRGQSEVDAAAKALSEQIAGASAEFEGAARGNPKIHAGTAIAIDNLGAPFDGKYVVTSSRHVYDQTTGYTTHFAVTGRQERSLFGLASGSGSRRAMTGVAIAQVSDARDPQHQGRVKLTFPWLSDDYVSDWARTVHAGAGKDRGFYVLPEVGDEVLVAFEQGDIRRPYVVGGLFNGVDTPKTGPIDDVDGGSGAINRRSLVSRRGHRIDLLDQDGRKEGIALATGDGKHTFTLDATGSTVTLHSDGSVTIEAKSGVTVDAGTGSLKLTGGDVSITATTGLTLDGGPSVKVNASGQVAVSGGMIRLN
ncbi:MAG TPA: VgrG-related protein [Pseudonocardia sp.]|nr:VgrG-related protein [Pseudonocardia sp.]